MAYSPLIDVIWKDNDSSLAILDKRAKEREIYNHLPVSFYGILVYSNPARRIFSVMRVDDARDFSEFNKSFQEIYNNLSDEQRDQFKLNLTDVKLSKIFVVKIKGYYYRCQFESVDEDQLVNIFLLDYGLFKKAQLDDLYALCEDGLILEHFKTHRALICTLPDDVNMYTLSLPNYAVFKEELEKKSPVEVIVLSFSTNRLQPCLAVIGNCVPENFNALQIDNYFPDRETAYWMIKHVRGEANSEVFPFDEQILLGQITCPYPVSKSELSAVEWSYVILVHIERSGKAYIRTVASSLRLSYIQDLLDVFYSVKRYAQTLVFDKVELKCGLPCVGQHPETNRYFRAKVKWLSGDQESVCIVGVDNPAFEFIIPRTKIYKLALLFFSPPEVEIIEQHNEDYYFSMDFDKDKKDREATEEDQKAEVRKSQDMSIIPGDVVKVLRNLHNSEVHLKAIEEAI